MLFEIKLYNKFRERHLKMGSKLWPASRILESLNYVAGKRVKPQYAASVFKNYEPATGFVDFF